MTADLYVMIAGALLIAAGAGMVFVPAGLVALGVLCVLVAWPDRNGKGGDGR